MDRLNVSSSDDEETTRPTTDKECGKCGEEKVHEWWMEQTRASDEPQQGSMNVQNVETFTKSTTKKYFLIYSISISSSLSSSSAKNRTEVLSFLTCSSSFSSLLSYSRLSSFFSKSKSRLLISTTSSDSMSSTRCSRSVRSFSVSFTVFSALYTACNF